MKHENLPSGSSELVRDIVANCLSRAGLCLTHPEQLEHLEEGEIGLTVNLTIPGGEEPAAPLTFTCSVKELQHSIPLGKNFLRCDELEIDCRRRRATLDDKPLSLTPRELQLLTSQLPNRPHHLSRSQLLGSVWELGYSGDNRTVDTHVKCLRHKLGEFGRKHIVTVRKAGYRFETFK